jgi:hypothetical protein
MSSCHQAIPPAPARALARAGVGSRPEGRARSSSSRRRPSVRCPRCCQNRHSAPAAAWAGPASPRSMAQRRAARMLACSRSQRSSHSLWSWAVRWGSASSARPRKCSAWRRLTCSRSPSSASRSCPNSRIVSSRENRGWPAVGSVRSTSDWSTSEVRPSRTSRPSSPGPQTASADSSVQPPANTDSRANSRRSGSESRSWLQAMAPRRVRCRSGRSWSRWSAA